MQKGEAGFTIVELIVVIAIIAVLSGIVMGTTVHYIARARDTATKTDIAQIVKGMHIYYTENATYESYAGPAIDMPCNQEYEVNKTASQFAVFARLCSTTQFYCVDSTGLTAQLDTVPATPTCVEGEGSYYCEGGCVEGEECQPGGSGNECVAVGACGGTCSGCSGLGSNDYGADWSWNSFQCQNYGGSSCCTYYAGCGWDGGSNSCTASECTGADQSSCGGNCPDASSCSW